MSEREHDNGQQADIRSSVKLVRNAKGETQIEVKVRALNDTASEVIAAKELASTVYDDLRGRYTMDALRPRS